MSSIVLFGGYPCRLRIVGSLGRGNGSKRGQDEGLTRRLARNGEMNLRKPCREEGKNWSNQLDPGSAFDLNDITDGHLSPLALLDLAIDADASLGDEGFRLTAAQDASRQFENLGQVDRTAADFEAHALDIAHCWPFGVADLGPPSRCSCRSIESETACSTSCRPFSRMPFSPAPPCGPSSAGGALERCEPLARSTA